MKKLILTLLLAFNLNAFSQLQFDYLGGLTIDVNSSQVACMFFDFDGNAQNDIKFVHGKGLDVYVENVNNALYFPTTRGEMWFDCSTTLPLEFNKSKAYIKKGNSFLSSGTHCLPFIYNGKFGYFMINVIDANNIKIRGYIFNMTVLKCYDLTKLPYVGNNPTE